MTTADRPAARATGRGWSIRRRLLLPLLAILVVGLAGGPLVASLLVRDSLQSRAEAALVQVGATVGGFISGRDGVVLTRERLRDLPVRDALVMVALDEAGTPVGQVQELGSAVAPSTAGDLVAASAGLGVGATTQITSSGRTYLVARTPSPGLEVELDDGAGTPVAALVLARDRTDDVLLVQRLERTGYGVAALALVVLGGTSAVVLRRGLRPIEEMADAVRSDGPARGDLLEQQVAAIGRDAALETRRLAEALATSLAARREAEEALRAFVADASHELRTPLTTLSGWLDLYAQGGLEDPGERDRAMARMEAEVGRMRVLVEELDLLARLDRGRPVGREPVELRALLAGVVDDARVVSPDRVVTLVGDADLVVPGDRARLEQVFRNLVGNATQHTPAGTPVEIETEVPAGPDSGHVLVRVVDHGAGIAEDQRTQVFERFHRAGSSRAGGSGLGLAIVRALVEAHDGTVGARETTGGGATVVVALPVGAGVVTGADRTVG